MALSVKRARYYALVTIDRQATEYGPYRWRWMASLAPSLAVPDGARHLVHIEKRRFDHVS